MFYANEKAKVINTKAVISNDILLCLSSTVRGIIRKIPEEMLNSVEEIRLRLNKPLMIYDDKKGWFVSLSGALTDYMEKAYIVREEDIRQTMELISNSSIYAIQDELQNGFVTIPGGHRVGIAGRTVIYNGKITHIKEISAINIRVSKEIIGAADNVLPYIIQEDNTVCNTLIVSPPQCGKTTLLRDIARQLSYGIREINFKGIKVGVVDERSELAGCYKGVAQNDLGPRTDVLDACPKAFGMLMMIRSMSPEVIITDEIGTENDIEALIQVLNAGVKIITSVHGYGIQDIIRKPALGNLMNQNIFEKVIVLSKRKGTGTIESIIDKGSEEWLT